MIASALPWVLSVVAASPVPPAASPAQTVTVPLVVLKTRHIAVDVRINHSGPVRLVLDTGSPVTFLSNAAAVKVGVISAQAARQPGLLGMRAPTVLKSIDVGGAQVKDLSVLVLDHPTIGLLSQVDGPIDGIVGFSFFARFRTVIDYAASRVSFTPVNYTPRDVMSDLLQRFTQPPPRRIVGPGGVWGLQLSAPREGRGMPVAAVVPRSPAAEAGLRKGDRIAVVDGRWTDSLLDFFEAAAQVPAGTEVELRVLRGGEEMTLRLRPAPGL